MNSALLKATLSPPSPPQPPRNVSVESISADATSACLLAAAGIGGSVASAPAQADSPHQPSRVAGLVRPARIYLQTARTYMRRAGFLLLLGTIVFVPLGLLDALADRLATVHVNDLSDLSYLATAALGIGVVVQATTGLLGEVFYSGAVALTLAHAKHGHKPTLREIAGSLSYGRLIAVDILFGFAVAIGLVLLIVPGIILFTWFSLAGPLVEIEDEGVRASLARSRRLVKGRFWAVLVVLGPITVASEALTNALLSICHGAIASPFLRDWVGEALTNVAFSPLYAVAAVLITLELRESSAATKTAKR